MNTTSVIRGDVGTPAYGQANHDALRPPPSLIRRALLFSDLRDDVLARVAAISTVVTEPESALLCEQGAMPTSLLLLVEGQVALETESTTGNRAVVEVVRPGGHFVLSTVLSALPYLMSARSVTAVKLIAVDATGLRGLMHEEISIASALLRAEAIDFGSMVRQVCDLKLRTTAQRLGCYLLALSPNPASNTVSMRLPFDKRLLAARLGCRQENLSRAFAALRQLGVETHGSRVILHDIAKLHDYALPDELSDGETLGGSVPAF